MKNKKIFAFILAAVMTASILPFAAFAGGNAAYDPAKFFSAGRNTVTFLKDSDEVVLDMWLFKGDHGDVADYKGLKAIKTGSDYIYSASLTKLSERDVPVRVDGSGVYTVIVRQKDGTVHSHTFEMGFEHLLPTFAADAVTNIPADVQLIRYLEGDHSGMTMKEFKASGASVICCSYMLSIGEGRDRYYDFKKQCVGAWTFAVQYDDGNVKTVVVENEAIPEPAAVFEKYGITYDVGAYGTLGFALNLNSTDNSITERKVDIKIEPYDFVDRVYTDHLSEKLDAGDWYEYDDGILICPLPYYDEAAKLPKRSSYELVITLTVDGESETVRVKVKNPGIWAD